MGAVPMDVWIFLAGLVAGSVNAAAGGGNLLAFPVLIGVAGLSPLAANTTCTVGLLPGIIASTGGYWRELSAGLRRDARRQLLPSALGGLLGAWLLLSLGGRVFARVVPWLLVVSAILIAVQPLVNRWLARHRPEHGYPAATVVVPFAVSVYGGYFGAAQGIPFLAAMGLLLPRPIGDLNALRILNAMINNPVAALTFIARGSAAAGRECAWRGGSRPWRCAGSPPAWESPSACTSRSRADARPFVRARPAVRRGDRDQRERRGGRQQHQGGDHSALPE